MRRKRSAIGGMKVLRKTAGLPPAPRAPRIFTRSTPKASKTGTTLSGFRRKPRRSSPTPSKRPGCERRPELGSRMPGCGFATSQSLHLAERGEQACAPRSFLFFNGLGGLIRFRVYCRLGSGRIHILLNVSTATAYSCNTGVRYRRLRRLWVFRIHAGLRRNAQRLIDLDISRRNPWRTRRRLYRNRGRGGRHWRKHFVCSKETDCKRLTILFERDALGFDFRHTVIADHLALTNRDERRGSLPFLGRRAGRRVLHSQYRPFCIALHYYPVELDV